MVRTVVALGLGVCIGAGCPGPAPAPEPDPAYDFPGVYDLPDVEGLPDLFASTFDPDKTATTPDDFTGWRRDELLALFAHHVYGKSPPGHGLIDVEQTARLEDIDGLDADLTLYDLTLQSGVVLHLALLLPQGAGPAPVIVAPNKCGNHTVFADEAVPGTTAFSSCGGDVDATRNTRRIYFSPEHIVGAGFGLATYHESDAAPDDQDRIADFIVDADRGPHDGAMIAAWTLANQRVMDALVELDTGAVDTDHVFVYGHSRRGKTALWTAANDRRFFGVIAHQSGTGGAPLLRNGLGETIEFVTGLYPHWFCDDFRTFQGYEQRLPVDSHQLLALLAPRPVWLSDGADDFWADPDGARDAAVAAVPAYALLGRGTFDPVVDDGPLSWRLRPGAHSVEAADWERFMAFAAAAVAGE